jgi:hypothetical protein
MDSFTVRKLQGYKTVASIVYQGLYRELDLVARAMMLWAGTNGYHSVGRLEKCISLDRLWRRGRRNLW